jgi:8-oxo-dGTP pyrophosphatase MutT (NUDIX family)
MYVNARAIIEREGASGPEIVVQVRDKPHEGGRPVELPGGRVEEYESLVDALRREVQEETGLTVTSVEGLETRIIAEGRDTRVECLRPFAVYQTISGPVDSMGVYFCCRGEGTLLARGEDAEGARWVPVQEVAQWMEAEWERFSWVDRAGLRFYLDERDRARDGWA